MLDLQKIYILLKLFIRKRRFILTDKHKGKKKQISAGECIVAFHLTDQEDNILALITNKLDYIACMVRCLRFLQSTWELIGY